MAKQPEESDSQYHARLMQIERRQQLHDLHKARIEAQLSGKQPFDYQAFSAGYRKVSPLLPSAEEMEVEYYLVFSRMRNLNEFLEAIWQSGLYDGGDMQLDR